MIKRNSLVMDIVHMYLFLTLTAYFLECWFFTTDTFTASSIPFLIFGIYYAFSTFLAENIKKFWIYLLYAFFSFLCVCYIGVNSGYAFPLISTSLFMIILHCLQRIRGDILLVSPIWQMIIYFAVTYFIAMYIGCGAYMNFAVYFSMAYIVLVIFDMNNQGLVSFLNVRNNVSSLPVGQIKRTNSLMLLELGVVIAVMFILSSLFMDNGPIYFMLGKLQEFLKWLGQFIHFSAEINSYDTTPVDADEMTNTADYVPSEHAVVNSVDERILYVIAAIIIAIGIISLLYAAFRLILKLIKSSRLDEIQVDKDEYAEDIVINIKPKKKSKEKTTDTPDMQIRKRYRREVMKKRKEHKLTGSVDVNLTPKQIEEEAVYSYGPEKETVFYWNRLHDLYEKARYSNTGCTADEASSVSKPVR